MENRALPRIQTERSDVAFLSAEDINNGNSYDGIQEGGDDTTVESPSVKWKHENEQCYDDKGSQNSSVNTSTETELSNEENVDTGCADNFNEFYGENSAYNDDSSDTSNTETPISSVRESKQTSVDSEESIPSPKKNKRKVIKCLSKTSSRQQLDSTVSDDSESKPADEYRPTSGSLSPLFDIKIKTSPCAQNKRDTKENGYRCNSSSKYSKTSGSQTPLEQSEEEVTPIPPLFSTIRLNKAHSKDDTLLSIDKDHQPYDHVVIARQSVRSVDHHQWNTESVASCDNSCNVTTNCSTSRTTADHVRNPSSSQQNSKLHERTTHVTTTDLREWTSHTSLPSTDKSPQVNTDKRKVIKKKAKDTQSMQLLKETKQHGSHKTITPTICCLEDFSIADYQRELPATDSRNNLVLRQTSPYVSRARATAKNIKKEPIPHLDMDRVSRKLAAKECLVLQDTLPPITINKEKLNRMYQQKYNKTERKSANGGRGNVFPPVFKTNNTKPKQLNDKCKKAKQTKFGLSMMRCYSPVNRNIILHRAQWPPFNTYVDAEASVRFQKMFCDYT